MWGFEARLFVLAFSEDVREQIGVCLVVVGRVTRLLVWGAVSALVIAGLVTASSAAAQVPMSDEGQDPSGDLVESEPDHGADESSSLDELDVAAARDQAASTGERVEIESARNEWDTVYAEPSGELTLDTSIAAVRTRVDAPPGEWREIDISLERTGDGLTPAAPALPLEFSDGGDEPLARIGRDGHELALTWPEALPTPVVEGTQATYPDVLPGADLVVSVLPDGTGFSEVLVVQSPEAAANPALAEFDLGLDISADVELVSSKSGGFEVVDQGGEQVFVSPPPIMWDSSGGLDDEAALDEELGGLSTQGQSESADVAVRSRSALKGDRIAEVATQVSDGAISLVPDKEMLTDPDTEWPVYIDPGVSGSRNAWTMIQSAWPTSAAFRFSGTEGMGYCAVARESNCVRNNIKRLAWTFGGLGVVRGADVSSATFSAYGTHSYNCTRRYVWVYRINAIDSGSNWRNKSGWWDGRRVAAKQIAHRPNCPKQQDKPHWFEFGVSEAARWAANSSNTLSLGMRALNESVMTAGWKRYRWDAKLSVTYNHPPNKPTGLRTSSSSTTGCRAPEDRHLVNDNTPVLRAKISDPNGDNVRGRFYWVKRNADGTWPQVTVAHSAFGASGTERMVQLPPLSEGWYRWRVRGQDHRVYGPWSTGSNSVNCYFEVDTTPPAAPSVSIDSPYLFGWWHDPVVGLPQASITVSRGSDTDVSRIRYQIGGGPRTTESMTSSTKTITLDPTYGVTTLRFWLLDKAGNVSLETTRELKIMSPRVQHAWLFNEGSGSAAADVARPSWRDMDVDLGSGVSWADGYRADIEDAEWDSALHFNESASGATTSEPGVFARDSFTVTARVKLDELDGGGESLVVVSQDGPSNSVFNVGYYAPTGTWAAWMHTTGESGGSWIVLDSGKQPLDQGYEETPPFPDEHPDWQHLALVHDAASETLLLYIDGECAPKVNGACDPMPTTGMFGWDSTGPLRIGRGQANGSVAGSSSGKVDDVLVLDVPANDDMVRLIMGALFEDEVRVTPIFDETLRQGLLGWWSANEGSGTTLPDASGSDNTATLQPGASWATGWPDGSPVLSLDGTSGHARTSGQVLDTTSSFSVSAWARIDELGQARTLLAQEGTTVSPFRLMYRADDDAWCFTARLTDGASGALESACGPAAEVGQWVHLAGVYDAHAGEARLYVNGLMVDAAAVPNLWSATGSFLIGRAADVDGLGSGEHFSGEITQVLALQRVLSPAEIAHLAMAGSRE